MKTAEMDSLEGRRLRRSERIEIEHEESTGLFGSIRRAMGTFLAVFESRVELLTVELKELKGRAMALVFWGIALAFLAFMTLVAIMVTVVFLLWDQAFAVLAGFSGFFVVLALGSFFVARNKLKKNPLAETVAQLRKDRTLVGEEGY